MATPIRRANARVASEPTRKPTPVRFDQTPDGWHPLPAGLHYGTVERLGESVHVICWPTADGDEWAGLSGRWPRTLAGGPAPPGCWPPAAWPLDYWPLNDSAVCVNDFLRSVGRRSGFAIRNIQEDDPAHGWETKLRAVRLLARYFRVVGATPVAAPLPLTPVAGRKQMVGLCDGICSHLAAPSLPNSNEQPLNELGSDGAADDGPFEPFGFRFGRVEVANLPAGPHRLIVALWDRVARRPRSSCDGTALMAVMFPEEPDADDKFKNLRARLQDRFNRADMSLSVRFKGGKCWLQPR